MPVSMALLGCALLLGGCGSTQLYTIAPVPVPAYLNNEVPANVPELISIDRDFSSSDERVATSTSSTAGNIKTTTYRWSDKNYMANGVYQAAKRLADAGEQPVFVNSEFQFLARFAAGDTYDYCWFDGNLSHEEE